MFIEVPATKISLSMRKPVYGVGINDSNYIVSTVIDGKHKKCPFYEKWKNILTRCYSAAYHKNNPSYIGCSVCKEWLTFSNFKSWMIKQDWQAKDLDKDILVKGNKTYSPELCVFVSKEINNILTNNEFRRGIYPLGVFFCNQKNKFLSKCNVKGKPKHIGFFDNPTEASNAYKKFKSELILDIALKQTEPLRSALIIISNEYKNKTSR